MNILLLVILSFSLLGLRATGIEVLGQAQHTDGVLVGEEYNGNRYNTIQSEFPSIESLLVDPGSSNQSELTGSERTSERPKGNISRLIEQLSPGTEQIPEGFVYVVYESPTTVVLKGDALTVVGEYNTILWKAVDLLENNHGYNLDQVVVNGLGSKDNPDRFYIVMTK